MPKFFYHSKDLFNPRSKQLLEQKYSKTTKTLKLLLRRQVIEPQNTTCEEEKLFGGILVGIPTFTAFNPENNQLLSLCYQFLSWRERS